MGKLERLLLRGRDQCRSHGNKTSVAGMEPFGGLGTKAFI